MRWLARSRSGSSVTSPHFYFSRPFILFSFIHFQALTSISLLKDHTFPNPPPQNPANKAIMPSQLDSRRTSELRASLSAVGSTLDAELRPRITTIHSNSAALASQQADLTKQTAKVQKESAQWQKMADNSRGKLKELGDFENWAEMLERDLQVLEETMRIVDGEGTDQRDAGSHMGGANGSGGYGNGYGNGYGK
jgi:GCN5-like protein 1 (GCN5L1)